MKIKNFFPIAMIAFCFDAGGASDYESCAISYANTGFGSGNCSVIRAEYNCTISDSGFTVLVDCSKCADGYRQSYESFTTSNIDCDNDGDADNYTCGYYTCVSACPATCPSTSSWTSYSTTQLAQCDTSSTMTNGYYKCKYKCKDGYYGTNCEACPDECPDPNDWQYDEGSYVRFKCDTSDTSPTCTYQCMESYYGTPPDGKCEPCEIGDTEWWYYKSEKLKNGLALSTPGYNKVIQDCYIPADTEFTDDTGTFVLEKDAYYREEGEECLEQE